MSLDAGRVGVRADQVDIHGRVTSPSFLNELLEDLPEWTDMPVWVNGTEELLPSNNSVPVTSPILTDIVYPDIRRDNQYFTYRESPTPVDGLAKIKSIKGNTLVWKQLIQNGNFADTSNWYARDNATLTVSNNVGTLTTTSAAISAIVCRFSYVQGHKYLIKLSAKSSSGQTLGVGLTNNNGTLRDPWMNINATSTWQDYYVIGTANDAPSGSVIVDGLVIRNNKASAQTVELKNVQVFDLTAMGLDSITSVDEFTALFPLSFYPYTQGELISFNGNGIKTVGFNQWDEEWEAGILNSDGSSSSASNRIITSYVSVLPNTTYSMTIPYSGRGRGAFYDENKNLIKYFGDFPVSGNNDVFPDDGLIRYVGNNYYFLFIPPAGTAFVRYNSIPAYGATYENNICINISDSSKNGTYEPYTESLLNLPISTYFPSGMKSINPNKYSTVKIIDELTPLKAITRIGRITIDGNTTMNPNGTTSEISAFIIPINGKANGRYNIMSDLFEVADGTLYSMLGRDANNNVQFALPPSVPQTVADGKAWFAQHPTTLYYELATPVELPTLSLGE